MITDVRGEYTFYSSEVGAFSYKTDFDYTRLWKDVYIFTPGAGIKQEERVKIENNNPEILEHIQYICNQNLFLKDKTLFISATGFSTVISGIKL